VAAAHVGEVVNELKIVLEEKLRVGAVGPHGRQARDVQLAEAAPGDELDAARCRGNEFGRRAAVEAEARLVHQAGTDDLALLDGDDLLPVDRLVRVLREEARDHLVGVVEQVPDEERVGVREGVVDPDGEEVVARDAVRGADELGRPATQVPAVRAGEEVYERAASRVHGDVAGGQDAEACVVVGDDRDARDALELAQPLVAAEEEGLVLDDRAAEGEAELVAPELRLPVVEEVARVQVVVAQELEDRPVEGVGAGLGDGEEDAPGGAAVLGAVAVGEHPELFDGLDADEQPLGAARRVVERVVECRPVELEEVLAGARARDREARAAPRVGRLRARAAVDHAGLEQDELRHVAPVEREVTNLLVVNDRAQGRVGRLDLCCAAVGDEHRLDDPADRQRHVQDGVLGHGQLNLTHLGVEPRVLDSNLVRARGEADDAVGPGLVTLRLALLAGLRILDGDARAGNDRPLRVGDGAGERAAGSLAKREGAAQQDAEEGESERAGTTHESAP
jgi:hypothetical protein